MNATATARRSRNSSSSKGSRRNAWVMAATPDQARLLRELGLDSLLQADALARLAPANEPASHAR